MKKIGLFTIVSFVAFALVFSLFSCQRGQSGGEDKVVYHLSELAKAGFVLNNINNHIKGSKDAKNLDIILVVHGPGLKAFHKDKSTGKLVKKFDKLKGSGVRFNACGNTMNAQSVELPDLLGGFTRRDEGGVVRIAELQSKGYLYIRP